MVELTGIAIWRGQLGYDQARKDRNAAFDIYPLVIVYCQTREDVKNALVWALSNDIPFRIRSGGHSYEAFSLTQDGLVIDVSMMNTMRVNVSRDLTIIEAGCKLGDIYETLSKYKRTIAGGTCPTVGVAGLMLGGGIGMLQREYGIASDNLVAAELVFPFEKQGVHTVWVSEERYPDLFWAIRGGGGGNFGIATSFLIRTHPIDYVTVYSARWPWRSFISSFQKWQEWAPFTDYRLTSAWRAFNGSEKVLETYGQFIGSADELQELIKPLLSAVKPDTVDIRRLPFTKAVEYIAGPPTPRPKFKDSGTFAYCPLPHSANEFMLSMANHPKGDINIYCLAMGGRIGQLAPWATAFPHRHALFAMEFESIWKTDYQADECKKWISDLRTGLEQHTRGAYINFPDLSIKNWPQQYYGGNICRLNSIKQLYDPCNIFNFEQSIPE